MDNVKSTNEEDQPSINPYGEIIAQLMIEKMIAIAATEVFNKKVNEKIPSHCFEFVKNCMNKLVHLSFIPHERDDLNFNVNNYNQFNNSSSSTINQATSTNIGNNYNSNYIRQPNSQSHTSKTLPMPIRSEEESIEIVNSTEMDNIGILNYPKPEEIFFDNRYMGYNQWIDISEPKKTRIDRSASSLIKVQKAVISTNARNSIFNDSKDKDKEDNDNSISELRGNETTLKEKNSSKTAYKSPYSVIEKTQIQPSKKVIEFEQWEIEELKNQVEENFVLALREEKKRELRKKEEEVKIKQNIEKEKEVNRLENSKNKKEVDGKKITFDVDGNPINIKQFPIEKIVNSFSCPKSDVKEKGELSFGIIPTGSSANASTRGPLGLVKIDPNDPMRMEKILSMRKNSMRNLNLITNITNTDRYYPQYNSATQEKLTVQPAGSNFDLIFPEIGVTVIEGTKKKGGEKDFFKKFQKYSKHDYTIMLRESAPNSFLNSMTRSQINLEEINSSSMNAHSSSLPYLAGKDSQMRHDNNVLSNSLGKNPDYMNSFISKLGNNSSSPKNLAHSMDNLKLSNKLTMSLKSTLDHLDYIPEYEEKLYEDEESMNNLGGRLMRDIKIKKSDDKEREIIDKQNASLELINKFNYSILRNSQWGSNSIAGIKDGNLNHNSVIGEPVKKVKPNRKELEKEMGIYIVKTKLPRSRVFNLSKNIDKSSNAKVKIK